jgi:hypothetical protein
MWFHFRRLSGLGLTLISLMAAGQSSLTQPSLSNLRMLSRNAGYIFDGTVLSVEQLGSSETDGLATVQISFRVEQAIRGTRRGQILKIQEWAGLWNSGERYRPGQRLLLFFYSPSKLGLTSPVGGPLGRFAVDSKGNALLEDALLPVGAPDSHPRLWQKNRVNARALALAIRRADAQ